MVDTYYGSHTTQQEETLMIDHSGVSVESWSTVAYLALRVALVAVHVTRLAAWHGGRHAFDDAQIRTTYVSVLASPAAHVHTTLVYLI